MSQQLFFMSCLDNILIANAHYSGAALLIFPFLLRDQSGWLVTRYYGKRRDSWKLRRQDLASVKGECIWFFPTVSWKKWEARVWELWDAFLPGLTIRGGLGGTWAMSCWPDRPTRIICQREGDLFLRWGWCSCLDVNMLYAFPARLRLYSHPDVAGCSISQPGPEPSPGLLDSRPVLFHKPVDSPATVYVPDHFHLWNYDSKK